MTVLQSYLESSEQFDIQQALTDIMNVYDPDAGMESVALARHRITYHGGVLAYLAEIKAAVKELQDEK